jgi:hypothetical protein
MSNSKINKTMKKLSLSILFIVNILFAFRASAQNAELQIIHNAADPSASVVDIYVDGALLLDDFAFREATAFQSLPSNVLINVGVAPGTSTSVADTLVNFEITLMPGVRYVAIANGVLDANMFAANPDAASTGFTLFIQDNLMAMASNPSNVDFIVMHGATDAPTVDVLARNVATLVDDASYGDITPYISVPAGSYILDVTPGNDNTTIVASYEADLTTLAGGTAVVLASGFLDPSLNQNGPAFGLWAFLGDGTAIELPATSLARLQVIHNAADPAAASVDIYLNGTLFLDNFQFRTATPYVDAPAGVMLDIGVAPGNSTSAADTLVNFQVMLDNGNSYVAIANGVLDPMMFAPNPDAVSTAFTLFLQDGMRENSLAPSDVDLRAVHGASDAPTVDVIARNVATLVDDASYSDITPWFNVPAGNYLLDVTPGNNNALVVASFNADLTTLAGSSALVLASGFLDPSMNQNGAAFSLIAVLPDGQVIPLSNVTSIEDKSSIDFRLYPNPASDRLTLEFGELTSSNLNVKVTDMTGRILINQEKALYQNNITLNTSRLASGNYLLHMEDGNKRAVKLFNVM